MFFLGAREGEKNYHFFPPSFHGPPFPEVRTPPCQHPAHRKPNPPSHRAPWDTERWALGRGQQKQLPQVSSCCGCGRSRTFKVPSETHMGDLNLFPALLIPGERRLRHPRPPPARSGPAQKSESKPASPVSRRAAFVCEFRGAGLQAGSREGSVALSTEGGSP